MRHYIPDQILADMECTAKRRVDRKMKDHMGVAIHANVLLALIATYREARELHLQKSEQN